MKRDETFRGRATCPAHDRAQKPVRINREELPCDLKEGRDPTVNPTLLQGTPSKVFKHVDDARCVVASAQTPSSLAALNPVDLI